MIAPKKTADELVAEGERLLTHGIMVTILHPQQEWMAVDRQVPFLRSMKIPTDVK